WGGGFFNGNPTGGAGDAFSGNDTETANLLGGTGMCPRSALRCGKGSGNPQSDDLFAVSRSGALEGGLRGAFPPAGGRAVRGKPQPGLSAPPISSDSEAFARRCPGGVSGQPPGVGGGSPPPRHPLCGGQLGASHAGRRRTGMGSVDRR